MGYGSASKIWHAAVCVLASGLFVLGLAGATAERESTAALAQAQVVGGTDVAILAAPLLESTLVTWCGTGETSDNRLPQNGSLTSSTIRVFYAFPADAPDSFATLADAMVSDVAAIDSWWRGQDPTRAPRWDRYAFPGCSGGLGDLDLGVIPLARSGEYYTASSGFERVLREVAPHLGAAEKALVFLDGFVIDRSVCGVSQQAPRNGGTYGLSLVSLQSGCWEDLGAGAATARIAAHELGHNLGAVPSKAPNRCGDSSLGGHVCDSSSDLLFPFASAGMRMVDAILDVGRNDYYGHSSDWWDVQDSVWLEHLPLRALAVLVSGPGSVSSTPTVITCPGSCSATLESDATITLAALAAPGSEFYGWAGACAGESECRLAMTGDVSVKATFGSPRPTLTVRVKGKGRVLSAPSGVSCPGGGCSAKYPAGTRVTLRAQPSRGWRLARWSSPCGSKTACSVPLTADRTVAVTFVRVSR